MHRRLTAVWMAAVLGITSCPLPAAAAMLPENANFEEEAQDYMDTAKGLAESIKE